MSVSTTFAKPGAPGVAAILGGLPAAPRPAVTVGDHYRQEIDSYVSSGLSSVGTGLHFTAEAIPGVILGEMATIKANHTARAYQRIDSLPYDAAGKWKVRAQQILDDESAKADKEIAQLPMVRAAVASGHAIVTGLSTAGSAIADAATTVGTAVADGVTTAGQAIYDGGVYVVKGTVNTYKAAGRGFFGWLADLGHALFGWATRQKSTFTN